MSQLSYAVRRSPRRARLAACAVLVALAVLALVWIGRAGAGEERGRGPSAVSKSVSNVAVGKADAVDATGFSCTTSSQFSDMPGMSEAFSFGGTLPRPVIVLFQGSWEGFNPGVIATIRLTIDGVAQSGPADVRVNHRPGGDDTHQIGTSGFNFVSDPVAPGTHTATIQWRATGQQLQACVGDRSLIVLHK